MERSQLSLVTNGAYLHPMEQLPIDLRYTEYMDSEQLPERWLHELSAPVPVNYGRIANPRAVIVSNLAGMRQQVYPTAEQAAEHGRKVVQVVLVPAGHDFDAALAPMLELPPLVIDKTPQGCSQPLWLADGVSVWLVPKFDDVKIPVRAMIFPR